MGSILLAKIFSEERVEFLYARDKYFCREIDERGKEAKIYLAHENYRIAIHEINSRKF